MDLVFKRYSNPYFLDLCIENNDLDNFVVTLLKQIDEEKLWEMYLATAQFNDKHFNDWKAEITKSKKTPSKKMTRKEIDTTIKESQNILKNFKPPKEGGFYKC